MLGLTNEKIPFTPGSKLGWAGTLSGSVPPAAPYRERMIDAQVLPEIGQLPLTISLQNLLNSAGAQTSLFAVVQWGSGDGSMHTLEVNVGRSVVFTVDARYITVDLVNSGAGGQNPVPSTQVVAACSAQASARTTRLVRSIPLVPDTVNGDGETVSIPAFASALRIPRRSQESELLVLQVDGAGISVSEHLIATWEDTVVPLTPEATSVLVRLDAGSPNIILARADFDLDI